MIPALALAVDQSDPKASPPAADSLAAGFEKELVEAIPGLPPWIEDG